MYALKMLAYLQKNLGIFARSSDSGEERQSAVEVRESGACQGRLSSGALGQERPAIGSTFYRSLGTSCQNTRLCEDPLEVINRLRASIHTTSGYAYHGYKLLIESTCSIRCFFYIYSLLNLAVFFCSPLNMASFTSVVCNIAWFQTAVYLKPSCTLRSRE